jgi:transcriptional regulator with XRE-family HTH domain
MPGKRIAIMRKSRGMTQAELGRAIGISRSMIGHVEHDRGWLSLELAGKLAEALHCTTEDLRAAPEAPIPRARLRGRPKFNGRRFIPADGD